MLHQMISKRSWVVLLLIMAALPAYAQDAPKLSASSFLTIDALLIAVAAFLLVPIYILSKTLLFAAKMYWERTHTDQGTGSGGMVKVLLPVLLMFGAQTAFAQDAAPAQNPYGYTVWLMLTVIALEVFAIMILGLQTVKLLRLASGESEKASVAEGAAPAAAKKSLFAEIWDKINKFRPLEEEADIDTGHSYDGIRELDNITPPWFTAAFIGTIIFGAIYLWVYHVSGTGPRQEEELARELARAEEQKKAFLATQADNVDENTVTLLTAAGDIAAGKKIYDQSCAVCHRADLGGQVGPNLTDAYWIHGGSINEVFKLIKYGAQDKGMMPWKDEYSPMQIAQVASYILSMQGSNPASPKEPQGELYTPAAAAPAQEAAAQPQQAGI